MGTLYLHVVGSTSLQSSTYAHKTLSAIERTNKTIFGFLKKSMHASAKTISSSIRQNLLYATYAYNGSIQATTGNSPFLSTCSIQRSLQAMCMATSQHPTRSCRSHLH